jgi:hypothetical protein
MSRGESQPRGRRRGLSEPLADLSDAQRASVAAASGLFEQLIDEVRERQTPALDVDGLLGPLASDGNAGAMLAQMRTSAARAIDLYADLLSETVSLYTDAIGQALRRGDGSRPASPEDGSPVALSGAPGETATARIWLHNVKGSPLMAAELRLTGLTAHDGGTLNGIACAFSPAVLDVAAGSSASAELSVTLPADAPPGAYHGLVLATGAPAASVPVLLTVA